MLRSGTLGKLTLALLATAAAIGMAEVLARHAGPGPMYGRILALGDVAMRRVGDVDLWATTEPRAVDSDIARAAGDVDGFTVVAVGDSILYGVALAKEETYLERFARQASARSGRTIHAINLAVPGYNTRQEEAVYAEIRDRLRPDVVLLHYWGDDGRQYRVVGGHVVDIGDLTADGRFVVRAMPFAPALSDFLLIRSRLYDLATQAMVALARRPQPSFEDTVAAPLRRIHRRALADGSRLIVIASPELTGEHPRNTPDVATLRRVVQQEGIELIDLADWLSEARSAEVAIDSCHFNAEGHRQIAQRLTEHLAPAVAARAPSAPSAAGR